MANSTVATAKRLSIMIVDDHPLVRVGIRLCLSARPDWHICAETDNGEAALDIAGRHEPNIIILDFTLPLRNGLEVTRDLRHRFPKIGIVIYSMHENQQLVSDGLRAGARGWVSKNSQDVALLAAVEAVAGGRTYISRGSDWPSIAAVSKQSTEVSPWSSLTPRELQVVKLVAEGITNRNIATLLNVSIKTVDTHRTAAMRKIGVHTAAELVRWAIRGQLIQP